MRLIVNFWLGHHSGPMAMASYVWNYGHYLKEVESHGCLPKNRPFTVDFNLIFGPTFIDFVFVAEVYI